MKCYIYDCLNFDLGFHPYQTYSGSWEIFPERLCPQHRNIWETQYERLHPCIFVFIYNQILTNLNTNVLGLE